MSEKDINESPQTLAEAPPTGADTPTSLKGLKGQTADTLFPRNSTAPSPYNPGYLIRIFLDARSFFSTAAALGKQSYLAIACWLVGTSIAITRLEQELIKAELGTSTLNLNLFELILEWRIFWPLALALGLLAGWLLWFIGGWWFRLRIKFSGAPNPDPRLSRLVMLYAGLVSAVPHLAFVMWWTLIYENYLTAYAQEFFLTIILFSLSFWELFSAYRGVRTLFAVDRWRARLWFIILPALLYLTTFGLVALIFTLL